MSVSITFTADTPAQLFDQVAEYFAQQQALPRDVDASQGDTSESMFVALPRERTVLKLLQTWREVFVGEGSHSFSDYNVRDLSLGKTLHVAITAQGAERLRAAGCTLWSEKTR